MSPVKIMTDEEKRDRFKNFFKKKDDEERMKMEMKMKENEAKIFKSRTYLRPILPK